MNIWQAQAQPLAESWLKLVIRCPSDQVQVSTLKTMGGAGNPSDTVAVFEPDAACFCQLWQLTLL